MISRNAAALDLGFDVDDLATLRLALGPEGYEAEEAGAFFDRLRA